jgi:hypothetical protein
MPWDEVHVVQPEAGGVGLSGGKKAGGGSHSSAVGRSGGSGGGLSTPPLSSGAVKVAPDALGPAREDPTSSGGFDGRQRDTTPAADRSRPPPPQRGREIEVGLGPAPSTAALRRRRKA